MKKTFLILLASVAFACNAPKNADNGDSGLAQLNQADFQKTIEGKKTDLYTLTNKNGVEVKITNYGGRIVSIVVPGKDGKKANVVLGFKTLEEYEKDKTFQGSLVGRFANRIGDAKFELDGKSYQLSKNDGKNTLHGGPTGYYCRVWDAAFSSNTLTLTYTSADMEEGYPGELKSTVKYSLTEQNELNIDYTATTNKATVLNLTNHAYFNLAGEGNGDILGQEMEIFADQTTPVDSTLIPTGELAPVAGTPFDFNKAVAIGKRINDDNVQLKYGKGYDHNWVLRKKAGELSLAARVTDPTSGRVMEVLTTQPGIQFYSGNFLNGSLKGATGKAYELRSAFCLETQHFPDSPNKAAFPTSVLKPGETYHEVTIYKFSVK